MILFDPISKLRLLSIYMNKRIDSMPNKYMSFNKWLKFKYPEFVYNSIVYKKNISTHCFYCGVGFNKKYKKTIDHFFPVSKDSTHSEYDGILIICCDHCNKIKADMRPDVFIRKVTIANMTGGHINGFSNKSLKKISENSNRIFNDVLHGVKTRVYFISKTNVLPAGFFRVPEPIN